MEAGKYDVTAVAGASFKLELSLRKAGGVAVNLTGATVHAQVRKAPNAAVIVDLTPQVTSTVNGEVEISLKAAQTAVWKSGHWSWDVMLKLADGTVSEPIIKGSFVIYHSITKVS